VICPEKIKYIFKKRYKKIKILTCKVKFHPSVEFNPAKNPHFKDGI